MLEPVACPATRDAAPTRAASRTRAEVPASGRPHHPKGCPVPRRLSTLLVALLSATFLAAGHAPAARADDTAAPAAAARAVEQSGMTPEQVRAKLRAAGLPESALDAYLGGATTAPAAAAPLVTTTATDAGAATTPAAAAAAPAAPAAPASNAFGAEIFRWAPSSFAPPAYGPVSADYVVGPGDELLLTLWGDDQLSLSLPVGRDGRVTLPEVGQVDVTGLTLDAARSRLHASLARAYSGLKAAKPTTFMNVSIGQLRSIQVYVLGAAVRPGGYAVSSVSRVLNALYAAGGPAAGGSMRDVRVLRGGRVAGTVDLYDVILRGDTSHEVRLENGDVIFLPPAGRRVTVTGPLARTGVFELRPGEQLKALVAMAGGPLADADLAHAQIDRIVPPAQRDSLRGQDRIAVDVALGRALAEAKRDVELADADRLTVFAIGARRLNTVSIGGQGVVRQGTYEFRPGMKLRDLVERAGGLTPDAWLAQSRIVRTAPDLARSALRVNLADPAGLDLALQPLDEVSIASRWDLQSRSRVTIHGFVRAPGDFELLEGMTLADLLFAAGGLRDEAFPLRAEIARVDSIRGRGVANADTFSVALGRDAVQMRAATALVLRPRDAVFIRRDPDWHDQAFVTLSGEVRFPGTYALERRDERIADVVRRAGGLTELAYPEGAAFTRAAAGRINVDLPAALRSPQGFRNFALESGDELNVPRYEPLVTIEGAVWRPGATLHKPGQGIGYYITQASGFRRNADRRGVVVIMANGDVQRHGKPNAGSRIVVPARPDTVRTETLKDVASILSMIASALTTIFLVKQVTK